MVSLAIARFNSHANKQQELHDQQPLASSWSHGPRDQGHVQQDAEFGEASY